MNNAGATNWIYFCLGFTIYVSNYTHSYNLLNVKLCGVGQVYTLHGITLHVITFCLVLLCSSSLLAQGKHCTIL